MPIQCTKITFEILDEEYKELGEISNRIEALLVHSLKMKSIT